MKLCFICKRCITCDCPPKEGRSEMKTCEFVGEPCSDLDDEILFETPRYTVELGCLLKHMDKVLDATCPK